MGKSLFLLKTASELLLKTLTTREILFPTGVSRCAELAQSLLEALKKQPVVCVGLSIKHLCVCVAPLLPVLTQKPGIVKL